MIDLNHQGNQPLGKEMNAPRPGQETGGQATGKDGYDQQIALSKPACKTFFDRLTMCADGLL